MSKDRVCIDFDGTIYDGKGIIQGCVEYLTRIRPRYSIPCENGLLIIHLYLNMGGRRQRNGGCGNS